MFLRNKIIGRKRTFLSDKADGMDFPVRISDGLFAEADFDTEWLIRVLITELLSPVRYDYSNITVTVVTGKKRYTHASGIM